MVRLDKKVVIATLAGACIGGVIAVSQAKPDDAIGDTILAMFIAATVLGGMLGYAIHNLLPSQDQERRWP